METSIIEGILICTRSVWTFNFQFNVLRHKHFYIPIQNDTNHNVVILLHTRIAYWLTVPSKSSMTWTSFFRNMKMIKSRRVNWRRRWLPLNYFQNNQYYRKSFIGNWWNIPLSLPQILFHTNWTILFRNCLFLYRISLCRYFRTKRFNWRTYSTAILLICDSIFSQLRNSNAKWGLYSYRLYPVFLQAI